MAAKFFALLTNLGAAKLANATALGTKLEITQMAVGDGGGALPIPDPAQQALKGEKRRAAINLITIDPLNTNQIITEQVIPENEGGWWIREIGLFDKDGTLIAIANCPETYKPLLQEGSGRTQTIRVILIVSSTESVSLKIDPSVVLATRKYVDDAVIEVRQYADGLMMAHEADKNPHSQYLQIANALKEIKDANLVAKVLENLGLGEAAKRSVGSSINQIPDMSFFTSSFNGSNGFCKFPNGVIMQSVGINAIPAGGSLEVIYPIPFPTNMLFVIASPANSNNGTTPISLAIDAVAVTDSKKSIIIRNTSTIANAGTRLFALGK